MARAYLSLGSNVAGAAQKLGEAEARLDAIPDSAVIARSGERSAATGRARQRDYLYRVVGIETTMKARVLLDLCIGIEAAMGRDHTDVWGPRPIDIDLIAYDDVEIRSSRLHLPHAFAHSRPYILELLREIAPEVADFVVTAGTKPR